MEHKPRQLDAGRWPPREAATVQDRLAPGSPPPRQRARWTSILRMCLVGFAIWLVLDAPTLQHNAEVSPVGTRRTVALAILRPIAALSRDLGLAHIVGAADDLLGRHGNRPGNGSVFVSKGPGHHRSESTPGLRSSAAAASSGDVTIKPTAAHPLRVLIVGDSLGIDLGDALVNDLANTGVVQATLDGQVSTGLTRPDYFNWPAELEQDLAKYRPQVIVIMIGANDAQDFPGPPDIPYGTPQWDAMYQQRVSSFMQEATSGGAEVVWVGMPPMQDPGLSAAMSHIDAIDRSEAASHPGVFYLSSAAAIGGPDGQYAAYVEHDGQEVQVREPDGTHITADGSELLSQAVMAAMRTDLHISLPA